MLHKFAPKLYQPTDWPHLNFKVINIFDRNSGRKNGGEISQQVMERHSFLSFPPVSLVWVPPTRRLSQYRCPKLDLAALLNNIYNAYILKQSSIGATSESTFSLPKWVQKSHWAPQNAECPANVNGLNIKSSILHLD